MTVDRPVVVDEFHRVTDRYLIIPVSIDVGDQRRIIREEVFGVEIEDCRNFNCLPCMIDTDVARFGEEPARLSVELSLYRVRRERYTR